MEGACFERQGATWTSPLCGRGRAVLPAWLLGNRSPPTAPVWSHHPRWRSRGSRPDSDASPRHRECCRSTARPAPGGRSDPRREIRTRVFPVTGGDDRPDDTSRARCRVRAYTSPHDERACNHGRARGFDRPTRIRTSVSGSKALRAWPNYTMGLRATTDPNRRRFQRADPRRVTNERTILVAPVGGSDEETPPRGEVESSESGGP